MTTPGDPRTGRRWQALARTIITRDNGICWRCGHPGADTAGHVLPVTTHPHLALDPDNLRAEHGMRRVWANEGFDCIGNYAAGADTGQGMASKLETQRRPWVVDEGIWSDDAFTERDQ